MKRINQKGFVLLETLIVTVFVMSIFVFVYRNSVPMMGQYEDAKF
jgi:competence protein ComGC